MAAFTDEVAGQREERGWKEGGKSTVNRAGGWRGTRKVAEKNRCTVDPHGQHVAEFYVNGVKYFL